MISRLRAGLAVCLCVVPAAPCSYLAASEPSAENRVQVRLPEHRFAGDLLPGSPFGINTALRPDAPDLEARLDAMQRAGIKFGRQDFSWRAIEKTKGTYSFEPYDRLVETCRRHGILLCGDLTTAPDFHDPRKPDGVGRATLVRPSSHAQRVDLAGSVEAADNVARCADSSFSASRVTAGFGGRNEIDSRGNPAAV